MLAKNEVDTNTFSAHSTRHASTSNAFKKGVNLDTVRKTAAWTNNSQTFAKFYNRPVIANNPKNNFVESILKI